MHLLTYLLTHSLVVIKPPLLLVAPLLLDVVVRGVVVALPLVVVVLVVLACVHTCNAHAMHMKDARVHACTGHVLEHAMQTTGQEALAHEPQPSSAFIGIHQHAIRS